MMNWMTILSPPGTLKKRAHSYRTRVTRSPLTRRATAPCRRYRTGAADDLHPHFPLYLSLLFFCLIGPQHVHTLTSQQDRPDTALIRPCARLSTSLCGISPFGLNFAAPILSRPVYLNPHGPYLLTSAIGLVFNRLLCRLG